MCDCTLAIYCFIDDLLKSFEQQQDRRAQVTDSEVITIALVAMHYFGGNFERARCSQRTRTDSKNAFALAIEPTGASSF